jgi:hypothetical protein
MSSPLNKFGHSSAQVRPAPHTGPAEKTPGVCRPTQVDVIPRLPTSVVT